MFVLDNTQFPFHRLGGGFGIGGHYPGSPANFYKYYRAYTSPSEKVRIVSISPYLVDLFISNHCTTKTDKAIDILLSLLIPPLSLSLLFLASDQPHFESGNKVILPASALDQLRKS